MLHLSSRSRLPDDEKSFSRWKSQTLKKTWRSGKYVSTKQTTMHGKIINFLSGLSSIEQFFISVWKKFFLRPIHVWKYRSSCKEKFVWTFVEVQGFVGKYLEDASKVKAFWFPGMINIFHFEKIQILRTNPEVNSSLFSSAESSGCLNIEMTKRFSAENWFPNAFSPKLFNIFFKSPLASTDKSKSERDFTCENNNKFLVTHYGLFIENVKDFPERATDAARLDWTDVCLNNLPMMKSVITQNVFHGNEMIWFVYSTRIFTVFEI